MSEMHQADWWFRLTAGELDEAELRAWEAHRQTCPVCAREWLAWQQLDRLLPFAPPVPPVPADFARRTTALILVRRRHTALWLQALALGVAAGLIVLLGALAVLPALSQWLYLTWVFGPVVMKALELLSRLLGAWCWVGIPMGLVLMLIGVEGGLIPWITAGISASLIYCRRNLQGEA